MHEYFEGKKTNFNFQLYFLNNFNKSKQLEKGLFADDRYVDFIKIEANKTILIGTNKFVFFSLITF